MAFFIRTKTGRLKAYYWEEQVGKQKQIPRAQYSHLDTATDNEVNIWLRLWEQEYGKERLRIDVNAIVKQSDEVVLLFDSFLTERQKLRNISNTTVADEKTRFNRHVLTYFVGDKSEKDVRRWDAHTAELAAHLLDAGTLEVNQVKKVMGLLQRFSKYLVRRRILSRAWTVELPTLGRAATTPLEIDLTPESVLQFAETCPDRSVALMALLGFFAGLRPGETFGLAREDFVTGDRARTVARTYKRFAKHQLGSGLTVHITKAMQRSSVIGLPKTHYSFGWVNIWDKAAALLIASLLKEMNGGRLLALGRDMNFRKWRMHGYKKLGVTLHDLRRASGLYLGRKLDIELTLLQDHLRHSDVNTTVLYTRAPIEGDVGMVQQDWGDVG